jgi:hypothetical protein
MDIVKLRQRQEDAKNKVAQARIRIEEAKSRLEKLKQNAEAASAARESFKNMGVKGGISAIVASQVGNIRGQVIVSVQKKVLEVLNKFANQCPPKKEMERLVKTRNTLSSHLSNFDGRIKAFTSTGSNLDGIIATTKLAIKIIKAIPTPTAIIPPQVGGLGIPVNILTKYSDKLIQLDKLLERLTNESQAIKGITDSVTGVVSNLQNRIRAIDFAIEGCYLENLDNDLTNRLDEITSPNLPEEINQTPGNNFSGIDIPLTTGRITANQLLTGSLDDIIGLTGLNDFIGRIQPEPVGGQGDNISEQYKGLFLSVVRDPNSPSIAPKNYAIAKDSTGVIVLYGQSSFSADTRVLIEELKFRIDNQLP